MKESAFYQEILLEGRQEGRQEGRLEGRQEGRLEGRQEGRLEGEREGKLKVGQQLLHLGMSLAQVAQVTGLSEQELQQGLSL